MSKQEVAYAVPLRCSQHAMGASLEAMVGHVITHCQQLLHASIHLLCGEELIGQNVDDVVRNSGHIRQTVEVGDGFERLDNRHFVVLNGAKEGAGDDGIAVDPVGHVHTGTVSQTGGGNTAGIPAMGTW